MKFSIIIISCIIVNEADTFIATNIQVGIHCSIITVNKTDRYILFPVINVINQGRYGCTYIITMIIIIM